MTDKKTLLVMAPAPMPTVEIIVKTLRHSQYNIQVVYENQLSLTILKQITSSSCYILLIRMCSPAALYLLELIERFHINYLYYLDDNLWELEGNTPLARYHQHEAVKTALTTFVSRATQVITGSQNLADYVRQFNPAVTAMKAGFDFNLLIPMSETPREQIKIIYAGSPYRDQDFVAITPAIQRILHDYPEASFYFYGYLPAELKNYHNVHFDQTTCSYDAFIKKYCQGFAIGLAPLHNSLSSQAKSNLKYREYGACRIAGIYANQSPYADCIIHRQNGLLTDNTSDAWYQALQTLITNPELCKQIQDNAYTDIYTNYQHAQIAVEWDAIISKIPVSVDSKAPIILILLAIKIRALHQRCRHKLARAWEYYRYEGFRFTVKKIVRSLLIHE